MPTAASPRLKFRTLCHVIPLALAGFAGLARADETPPAAEAKPAAPTQKIEITGRAPDETAQRRESTAPTIVVGRDEIDRQGDSTIVDVLKRLPGVTVGGRPGRGGGISLRGMGGGWTQILINGEPARGVSLDNFTPEQVERIEITRSATAELGARGIAGTINIVLRDGARKLQSELRAGLEWEDREARGNVRVQHNDKVGALGYDLFGEIGRRRDKDRETDLTRALDPLDGGLLLDQREDSLTYRRGRRGALGGRLSWRGDGGDVLNLQPFLLAIHYEGDGASTLTQTVGAAPPGYATSRRSYAGDVRVMRLSGDWTGKLGGGRLNVRFNLGGNNNDNGRDNARREFDANGNLVRTVGTSSTVHDRNQSTAGKYSWQMGEGHSLTAGWDLDRGTRDETSVTVQNGVVQFADGDTAFAARTLRTAVFAQDDWVLSERWSAYAGLRGERIASDVSALGQDDTNTSQVWSPMLHSLWKFGDDKRTQFRASLARTYRSPNLGDLIARPRPNGQFPIDGSNDATHPDFIGNASLRPELAWGLDLALEHYPAGGGLLSANGFVRRIDDVMRNVTSLRAVDWSPAARWVTRPENIGTATSWGIELEAKVRLDQVIDQAPNVDLRANLSRFWSRIDAVPGPDNRIEGQPELTANVGADYRIPGTPLALGGNLNLTPGYTLRRSDNDWRITGRKAIAEMYAVWSIDTTTRLRFAAANLLADDYTSARRLLQPGLDQTTTTIAQTAVNWSIRLEMKL